MPQHLSQRPVHLGLGASAVIEPEFTGRGEWYEGYAARHASDGNEARLVALHEFSKPWSTWEMHPHGCEVVVCTSGELTIIQEIEGKRQRTELCAGQYTINEPGVWHTVDVARSATVLFITAGKGTQIRPR